MAAARVNPFSSYETQILVMAANGHTREEIGQALGRTVSGIAASIISIRQRIDARNLTHAVAIGCQLGWIPPVKKPDPPRPIREATGTCVFCLQPVAWVNNRYRSEFGALCPARIGGRRRHQLREGAIE